MKSIQFHFSFLFASLLLFIMVSCNPEIKTEASNTADLAGIPDKIDFTFDVKPILSDRCFKCHGPDKNAIEGDFSLATEADAYKVLGEKNDHYAIVPSNVEKSTLVNRIYTDDPNLVMPPPESNLILTEKEKIILTKWIEQGAKYKKHWAFLAPEPQEVPKPKLTKWSQNEIDDFILEKIELNGIQPSEMASPEKLIRRVSFDLTGLPPSPKLISTFTANPTNEAYEQIIDSLLATKDYAENMAAEWMDISRYADTHGYQDDFERTMWPWRDWVIHAFDKNMPYDKFVIYQLAGDMLPDTNLEKLLATGFNRNHKITFEGGIIPEEYYVEYVEDRLQTFGTTFLGLTFECARCHDHKYDPISQKEHFQLYSFFNNNAEKIVVPGRNDTPEPYITITEKEVEDVLKFINFKNGAVKEVPVMVMRDMEKARPAFILNRGVYDQPTDEVYPNTPESLLAFPENQPKNRLGLANWLFTDNHPLTSRVTVNRLWQRMFGKGLVSTSYDFGNQGALPSHPKLLDYLALKFQAEGWDIKRMLKYMAMSSTYKQKAVSTPEMLEKDPENVLLARAPRLRLTAEMIRDQALAISGLLYKEIGGPSVKPVQPDGLWEETTGGGGGSTAKYVPSTGNDLYRKSLYSFWKRTVPPPSMMTFDAASRDLCSVKRQETNTPLQALVLLNDPQLLEASRALAAKTLHDFPTKIEDQINHIFQKATSRLPDESELEKLKKHYTTMLDKIENGAINPDEYNSIGQFTADTTIDTKQLASLSLVAHTIMNLDETITRG